MLYEQFVDVFWFEEVGEFDEFFFFWCVWFCELIEFLFFEDYVVEVCD